MKKGFTLIELLAVIVILVIISLIVTPIVAGVIENTKESANIRSAEGYVEAANVFYNSYSSDGSKTRKLDGKTNVIDLLDFNGKKATSGSVTIDKDGNVTLSILYDNKCYLKTSTQSADEITISDDIQQCVRYKEDILNGSDPTISVGMIPVILADDGSVKKADLSREWYKYEDKKWANVVVVNEETRAKYQSAAPGSSITKTDILGYFVWIPRYKYQLFNVDGIDTTAKEIKIEFENNQNKTSGTLNDEWLTAPGFTFGTDELDGIWVGKFETTGTETAPTVLSQVSSLTVDTISRKFDSVKNFNDTKRLGINNDAHIAKNSEWAAIAYLSQSKYGRCNNNVCTEISINNSRVTGNSAGKPGDNTTSSATSYAYNTSNGYLASTTGNITGIYDMVGGYWEFTMGVIDSNIQDSGFTTLPDSKYYESYTSNQNVLGEALLETKGWYNDFQSYPSSSQSSYPYSFEPWFIRGGRYDESFNTGIFGYYGVHTYETGDIDYRTILVP